MSIARQTTPRTIAVTLLGGVLAGALLATPGCDVAEAEPIAAQDSAGGTSGPAGAADAAGAAGAAGASTKPAPTGDVKQAEAVLAQSATAYKKVPGLTDNAQLVVTMPDGQKQTFDMKYAMAGGTDAWAQLMGMTVASIGDKAIVTRDVVADKYIEAPLDGTLARTLDTVAPGFRLPPPFALRYGTDVAAYADSFGLGALREVTIAGYEKATNKAGRPVHAIHVAAQNGNAVVHIDSTTNLLSSIDLTGDVPGGGPKLKAVVTFTPKVHESPNGLVELATTGRTHVVSVAELVVTAIKKGDEAPNFTLTATDGRTVSLSELRGKVVVLDFWATWCMPCRRALPSLQQFDTWAREGDKPVAVFAIDTFERTETIEDMRTAAEKFWASQKFTMDNLLDFGNEVIMKYGYESIPTTVIVDPNGVVAEVHTGFDPNMFERLKVEVSELMPGG